MMALCASRRVITLTTRGYLRFKSNTNARELRWQSFKRASSEMASAGMDGRVVQKSKVLNFLMSLGVPYALAIF